MMSSHTNQYANIRQRLKHMPPSIVSSDEKPRQPSTDNGQRQRKPGSLRSTHRASMPPLSREDKQQLQRGGLLSASMNVPPVPATESDDSFTRDFFGSKRKPIKKGTWFSKRDLKVAENEGDDSNNDSNDSLRDPLHLPHILKRDARKPQPQQQQSYKSEESFDYDYANFGRKTYEEQYQQQQKQIKQHDQQQLEQPQELKTMQEHVKRRHKEEKPDDDSSQDQPIGWAAKPAPTAQNSWDDSRSITQTHIHNHQYSEAYNSNLLHNQRDQHHQHVQSHDNREYIRQFGLQNTPSETQYYQQNSQHQYHTDKLRDNAQLQQPQCQSDEWDATNIIYDIIGSTGARGEDGELLSRNQLLTELGIRLDEREIASQMYEQRRLAQRQLHQQPLTQSRQLNTARDSHQQLEHEPCRGTAQLPDDQTWIQDVLQCATKRNIPPDVLDALVASAAPSNSQDAPLQGQQRSSVESWMSDVLHTMEKEHCSRQVLDTLMESASRDSAKETQHLSLQGEQRNSVYSCLVDALQSAKREGYSPDALKALVDSVSEMNFEDTTKQPLDQDNPLMKDRNSTESWIADAQQSGAAPEVIDELLRADSASIGQDNSKKKLNSSKAQHHSIFIRDSRGPVPTDDMLNESLISFEGSASTGSRLVGDDVLVMQRNNTDTKMRAKSEASKDTGTSDDLDLTAHDLLDQMGPDVDIESIPNDVLKAFGITRYQLRRADSSNTRPRDVSMKVGTYKSDQDLNESISKACIPVSRQVYRQTSSPDDEVSWVEIQQLFINKANTNTTDATKAPSSSENSSQIDSLSLSQKELFTDTRGPIPKAEILDGAFCDSNKDGLSSSLKNLVNGVEKESPGQIEFTQTPSIDNSASGMDDEIKPSIGFMRHIHNNSGIHSNVSRATSQSGLEIEIRKRRMEVLATIEKSKQDDIRHDGRK